MNMCKKNSSRYLQKMAEIWHKTCQKQALFTSFRDFTRLSEFYFLTDFDASKSVLRSFFSRSLRKSDLKTCIATLNPDFFLFDLFLPHDQRRLWPVLSLAPAVVWANLEPALGWFQPPPPWDLENYATHRLSSLGVPRHWIFIFSGVNVRWIVSAWIVSLTPVSIISCASWP